MNDFTKEELQLLYLAYTNSEFYIDPDGDKFEGKLLSMIDNYCEHDCNHEWDGVLLTVKPNTGKCKKCGQVCYIAIKDIE